MQAHAAFVDSGIPFPFGRTRAVQHQGDHDSDSHHGADAHSAPVRPMQLVIRSGLNNGTDVEAFATDSVLDLKLALEERLHFLVEQMQLVHRYQILVDSDTLGESGITDGSVISLILRVGDGDDTAVAIGAVQHQGDHDSDSHHGAEADTAPVRPMQLVIRSRLNNGTDVEAFATDSVLDLKLALEERLHFRVDQMLLVHRYQILVDNDTLGESGITDGSVIGLILRVGGGDDTAVAIGEAEPIQLSIKIRRGKCVVVETSLGQSVGSVKRSIERQTDVPVSQQALVFSGEYLRDEETLAHYQLRDRCALRLEHNTLISETIEVRPAEFAPLSGVLGFLSQTLGNLFS